MGFSRWCVSPSRSNGQAKTKDDEMSKTTAQVQNEAKKLLELEHRLETQKRQSQERVDEVRER